MTDANKMLADLFADYVEHNRAIDLIANQRDAAPVSDFVWRIWHEGIDTSIAARAFAKALYDHGLTIHCARNRDGHIMPFISQAAAAKWLEDFPGTGAETAGIQAGQIFFKAVE